MALLARLESYDSSPNFLDHSPGTSSGGCRERRAKCRKYRGNPYHPWISRSHFPISDQFGNNGGNKTVPPIALPMYLLLLKKHAPQIHLNKNQCHPLIQLSKAAFVAEVETPNPVSNFWDFRLVPQFEWQTRKFGPHKMNSKGFDEGIEARLPPLDN